MYLDLCRVYRSFSFCNQWSIIFKLHAGTKCLNQFYRRPTLAQAPSYRFSLKLLKIPLLGLASVFGLRKIGAGISSMWHDQQPLIGSGGTWSRVSVDGWAVGYGGKRRHRRGVSVMARRRAGVGGGGERGAGDVAKYEVGCHILKNLRKALDIVWLLNQIVMACMHVRSMIMIYSERGDE